VKKLKPIISVIIPIYNGETYLKECIESLLIQTFSNIEIILVNNKSTDKTKDICDTYAKLDSRVKVIHRKTHGWICDGRNDGILASSGEWITFVDADDWVDCAHYEKLINEIGENSYDIFCQGGCICEYPSKSVIKYTGFNEFSIATQAEILNLAKYIFVPNRNNLSPINMSAPWDKLYNGEFIRNNKILFDVDVKFADDSFFNIIAFSHAKRIGGTSHIGYHYRQLSDSVTHKFRPDWPPKIYNYLEKLDNYLVENKIKEELYDAECFTILRCFLNMLRGYYINGDIELDDFIIKKELNEWKKKKLFCDAIKQKNNKYLSYKLKIFKMILKTNSLYLLRLLIWMERKKNE